MNAQDMQGYASFYTYVILDNVSLAISVLSKRNVCQILSKDDWYAIMQEFLFYNMNVCGRFTFSWFGVEIGEQVMDKIFAGIGSTIDENREKLLNDKLDSLSMQNFSDYLSSVSNISNAEHLRDLYNQRATEYSKYDLIREDKNSGKAGLLDWEFAEKLAQLLNRNNDAPFILIMDTLAISLSHRIVSAREVWDKTRATEKNDMRKCPRCGTPNAETAFRCKNEECLDILPAITQEESSSPLKGKNESWEEILKDVDFGKARDEIAYMLKLAKEDAEMKGGNYYIKNELNDALTPFMSNPCLENAIKLLEFTPTLYTYFEMSRKKPNI